MKSDKPDFEKLCLEMTDADRKELSMRLRSMAATFNDGGSLLLSRVVGVAEARIRQLEAMKSEWQPIETAPKDGTRVLMVDLEGSQRTAAYESIQDAWVWVDGSYFSGYHINPVAWQPLPEPPK